VAIPRLPLSNINVVVAPIVFVILMPELNWNSLRAEFHVISALGEEPVLPRSNERFASSVSTVALSELMVKVSATRLPPVSVPTRVVALTSLA